MFVRNPHALGNRAVHCNAMPTLYSWLSWGTLDKSLLKISKSLNLKNPLTGSRFSTHYQGWPWWAGHAPGGTTAGHTTLKQTYGLPGCPVPSNTAGGTTAQHLGQAALSEPTVVYFFLTNFCLELQDYLRPKQLQRTSRTTARDNFAFSNSAEETTRITGRFYARFSRY